MSTQASRTPPNRRTRSQSRRNTVLNVDLNAPPLVVVQEGTSSHVVPGSVAPIDVEELDDEVIISSPRAFAEAKNNSRRNRSQWRPDLEIEQGHAIVVDVESEDRSSRVSGERLVYTRRRFSTNQATNTDNFHIDLEGNSCQKCQKVEVKSTTQPPPKEPPTFSCPVCMSQLVEETSTKCGHIFCRACIKKSISSQGKCPTCRRKITMKDTIRVYLPAAC